MYTQPEATKLFPRNKFGQYVLTRDRVVRKVMKEVALQLQQDPGEAPSVYVSGCRGSGKTNLLMLLAKAFKAKGYEVYFFESARDIPQDASSAFKAMLKDKTKKVAVLIDEVHSDPNSGLFTALLKGEYPHLVTIGASVPRFIPTGLTAVFTSKLRMSDLVLQEDDEDYRELVQYCVKRNATTPELTLKICNYLLQECGGHTFPTLAFIEHFFSSDEAREFLTSEEAFRRYVGGADFARSHVYQRARDRCFEQLSDEAIQKAAIRVLGGKDEPGDISTLTRLGWWDCEASAFISPFLVNACLSGVTPDKDDVLYLSDKYTHEQNTELVIVKGLEHMEDSDFLCRRGTSGVRLENGVSFNWAHRARVKVPNAYLHFQERGESGVVDFYLNGFADTAIEVRLDATQTVDERTKGQSQDIDAHQTRFHDGKYHWKRYVLLNFAMSKDAVLPRDDSAHDKVYTFVRATNTLYRGMKLIKAPAIPALSGGSRFISPPDQLRVPTRSNAADGRRGQTRNFTTVAKRLLACVRR